MSTRFKIPNLPYLRDNHPEIYNALLPVQQAINNHSDQGNLDPMSAVGAQPSPVASINVVEKDGIHDIKISDQSPAYSNLQYTAEYSQTPDFKNSHRIDMGISQNHRANLGAGKYYWRASSHYDPATPSSHVYHGGAQPSSVGSGDYVGPPMQERQIFTGAFRKSSTPPIRQ